MEAALKKEVKQLKASSGKRERRFQAMDSGANNVIFIKTKNLGEEEFDRQHPSSLDRDEACLKTPSIYLYIF